MTGDGAVRLARSGSGLLSAVLFLAVLTSPSPIRSEPAQVNTIREVVERIIQCWKPPPPGRVNPIDITVIVSFNRAGEILGRPKISYESKDATDNDRLQYRIAVMETLQRCTPMPFTEGMAGAAAGHPFWIRFQSVKPATQPTEKKAWLSPARRPALHAPMPS
jgi:hypothetical protein